MPTLAISLRTQTAHRTPGPQHRSPAPRIRRLAAVSFHLAAPSQALAIPREPPGRGAGRVEVLLSELQAQRVLQERVQSKFATLQADLLLAQEERDGLKLAATEFQAALRVPSAEQSAEVLTLRNAVDAAPWRRPRQKTPSLLT
ncbi:MAG: hypothetical protein EXR79_13620 [Myxococcales bacterium]|nr:hypothetical protein [Myxococcales bacterium]